MGFFSLIKLSGQLSLGLSSAQWRTAARVAGGVHPEVELTVHGHATAYLCYCRRVFDSYLRQRQAEGLLLLGS